MKTTSIVKTLTLCALISLSLGATLAQAENSSCILGSPSMPREIAPQLSNNDARPAMMSQVEARMNQQMERIEQALRSGQISPMQAGKMMREQWEAVQFQRGFMEGNRAGSGNNSNSGNNSCNLMGSIDTKQLVQKMAPVVGGMAREGMQTATTVMRALAQEAGKLLREEEPMGTWY
jgi:hypothetical protein